MPPFDAALKIADPLSDVKYVPDNDDNASKTRDISDKFVYAAAQHVIDRHRAGATIKLEAFAPPHEALVDIAQQLEQLGVEQAMADNLITALKEYVIGKGGSFARAASAKPVLIALEVAEQKPDFRFEEGVTEMAAIDGVSAQVEGIGNVEIQYTASGTVMTSNRASVDKIFSSVKGLKLWVRFEAPTKSEMDAVERDMQGLMAMMGEAIGGAVSAVELKDILAKIQQDGQMSPEVINLVVDLIEMRSLIEAGVTPTSEAKIETLARQITAQLSTMAEAGIPVPVAQGVVQAIETLTQTYDIAHVIPPEAVQSMKAHVSVQIVTLQLAVVAEMLDDDARAELETLIDNLQMADIAEIMPQLDIIAKHIEKTELAPFITELAPALPITIETATALIDAQLPDVVKTQEMKIAEDLFALLETLRGTENLPPELQSLIEKIDGTTEALHADPNSTIDPALAGEIIREAMIALQNPDVQAALPQEALNAVHQFTVDNKTFVEAATVEVVIATLQTAMETGAVEKADATVIQTVIEQLKSGEKLQTLDTKQLEMIAAQPGNPAMPAIEQAIQAITVAKAEPVLLSNDTLAAIQTMSADLGALKDTFKSQPDVALAIEQAVEALRNNPADMTAAQQLAALSIVLQDKGLPAPAAAIEKIMTAQQQAIAIQKGVEPQQVAQVVATITTLSESLPTLPPAEAASVSKLIETLKTEIASPAAAQEAIKLQLNTPDMPAAVSASLAAIVDQHVAVTALKQNVAPEIVRDTLQTVVALETLKTENPQAFARTNIEPAVIAQILEGKAAPETVNATINTLLAAAEKPDALPAVKKAAETVIAMQAALITRDTGLPPAIAETAVRLAAEPESRKWLQENGIDARTLDNIKTDPVRAVAAIMQIQEAVKTQFENAPGNPVVARLTQHIDSITRGSGVNPVAVATVMAVAKAVPQLTRNDIKELAKAGVDVRLLEKLSSPAAKMPDIRAAEKMLAQLPASARALFKNKTGIDTTPPPKTIASIRRAFEQDNRPPRQDNRPAQALVAKQAQKILSTAASDLNDGQKKTFKNITDSIRQNGVITAAQRAELTALANQLPPGREREQLKKIDILASERAPANRAIDPDMPMAAAATHKDKLIIVIDKMETIPLAEREHLKLKIGNGEITQRQIDSIIEHAAADPDISASDLRNIIDTERDYNWPDSQRETEYSFETSEGCKACPFGKSGCKKCFGEATAEERAEQRVNANQIMSQFVSLSPANTPN